MAPRPSSARISYRPICCGAEVPLRVTLHFNWKGTAAQNCRSGTFLKCHYGVSARVNASATVILAPRSTTALSSAPTLCATKDTTVHQSVNCSVLKRRHGGSKRSRYGLQQWALLNRNNFYWRLDSSNGSSDPDPTLREYKWKMRNLRSVHTQFVRA
jgi:hypothetical protein